MTRRFRNVLAVVAAAAWLSTPAGAQQPPQGQTDDHDAHHRDMLTRGAQAMGFDQERTVHHFLLYEDGGAIDVAVKEASDHANLHTSKCRSITYGDSVQLPGNRLHQHDRT
jgi:uncharacterized protein (DUF2267 family)